MRRISRHWLLAAVLFGLSVPAAQAKSVALLVGISAYPQPENRLEGPKNDVASARASGPKLLEKPVFMSFIFCLPSRKIGGDSDAERFNRA